MIDLFKDETHQKQFDQDGFVRVTMLQDDDIRNLLEFYQSLNNDHITEYGFHVSIDNNNPEFVENVIAKIGSIVLKKLDPLFLDNQVTTASFVPPHQDWTFTDETKFASVTTWTPLQDVNAENGALAILKGSHKLFPGFRASPSPAFQTVFGKEGMHLFPYMEIIPMKAGETLIFDNRLVHASPPNYTDSPRIAAGLGLMHKEAELSHHYLNPGSNPPLVSKYKIDHGFFLRYNNSRLLELFNKGEKPDLGEPIESISHAAESLTTEELISKISQLPDVKIHPEMEKIAETFSAMFSSYIEAKQIGDEIRTEDETVPEIPSNISQQAALDDRGRSAWQRFISIFKG